MDFPLLAGWLRDRQGALVVDVRLLVGALAAHFPPPLIGFIVTGSPSSPSCLLHSSSSLYWALSLCYGRAWPLQAQGEPADTLSGPASATAAVSSIQFK